MVKTDERQEVTLLETPQRIAVTNSYRHRPIAFSVTGRSVRLGPFETCELDRDCLASPELSHLIRSGIVRWRELGAPVPAAAEAKSAEGGDAPQNEAGVPGQNDKPRHGKAS